MARGVNKVILIGNVGGDPEVRYLPNGSTVTTITLATSESWKDKQTGQTQERTEWHRVVFFNRLGEIAGEYLRKGSKVYVEGALRTNKWQDQEGTDRYRTEIIGNEMQMLDSRGNQQNGDSGQQAAQQNSASNNHQPNRNANGTQLSTTAPPQRQQGAQRSTDDFGDDIPFFNPYKGKEYLI